MSGDFCKSSGGCNILCLSLGSRSSNPYNLFIFLYTVFELKHLLNSMVISAMKKSKVGKGVREGWAGVGDMIIYTAEVSKHFL